MYANNNAPIIDRPSTSKTFKAGKSYATRSICDHDCWMRVTVLSRTAKTVTKTAAYTASRFTKASSRSSHGAAIQCA